MPGCSACTTLQYTGIGAFVAIVLYAVIYYGRTVNTDGLTRRGDTDADLVAASPGQQLGGLAPDDVAVLPMFTYHAASPGHHGGGGGGKAKSTTCCAVCLDELGEGALVRMLPSCKHYFHASCVDVWLLSHATCPVCRASPAPEKVRLGVVSQSPPLPQLRRCGASPKRGETSRAKDAIASRSPSPARSPTHLELFVQMGNASSVMPPSPTRPRTPENGIRCSRSPSPVTSDSHGIEV